MKIRIWHIVIFVIALAVFAIALAPAQLLFRGSEGVLTFHRAEGTIWRATLRQVDLGGLNGGDATVTASLFDLMQGSVVSDIVFAGPDLSGQVRLHAGLNGDRRLEAPILTISGLHAQGFGRVPGATRVTGLDITFRQQVCAAAQGQIDSDVLVKVAEQTGGEAPLLTGNAACMGQIARLTLQGEAAGDSALALLDLSGNGTGSWSVTYRTSKPPLAASLIAAGFMPDEQAAAFNSKGDMTWLPY
ncbi:MAG TPA: type II secretion system protein N [Hyphomonadaceae bacterium]|nr:type II secretion system protein N [Hyphomonadaceae bacterium]